MKLRRTEIAGYAAKLGDRCRAEVLMSLSIGIGLSKRVSASCDDSLILVVIILYPS